jgi:hypothetical protein
MQIFHIVSIVVPIVIAVGLPRLVEKKRQPKAEILPHRVILYSACILFFISWYLPSPLIHGEDTSFVTHFIGGGLFTGLLWLYLKKTLGWNSSWYFEAFSLFALVSALGAINELFELLLVEADISSILLTDTSWDILANTLGAAIVYGVYKVYDSWH